MLNRTFLFFTFLVFAFWANSQVNLNLLSNYVYPATRGNCSDIWGHVDSLGNEYAIVGNNNGTSIVDVSDPVNPVEVFFTSGPNSTWRDIKVWQDVAYVTNGTFGGLKIIDMSNLPGPITGVDVSVFTGNTYNFTRAHNFFIDENGRGYLTGADYGIGGAIIYDLATTPLAPIELGGYNDYYLHDVFVRGDTLWGAAIQDGFFVVVDVSFPSWPFPMATQLTPNLFTHQCWLSDDGNSLYTVDELSGSYIASYDVNDLGNIMLLDQVQSNPGSGVVPHNTFVVGDYLVTSYYRDGIIIHDASNPANLIEVGNYDTSPLSGNGYDGLWGVYPYLPSGNILGSDMQGGLFVWGATYAPAAYLEGNITDSSTSMPISNAQINIVSTSNTDLSDVAGNYAIGTAVGGTYTVTVSKLGYLTETIDSVVLTFGGTAILDVLLVQEGVYTLAGKVIDANSNPIISAQVKISNGVFTSTVTTNGVGDFSVSGLLEGLYDVYIGKWGYHSFCALNENLLIANNPHVYQLTDGYSDDFVLDLGWSVSSNASTGDWERGTPLGTIGAGFPMNPGADASGDCGEEAYVTGNAGVTFEDDDVDGGETVLYSPLFDLTTYLDPHIEFERWFVNLFGGIVDDSLVIELTNGDTSATIDFVVTTNVFDSIRWLSRNVRVANFITPTAYMQIQVRVMDLGMDNATEGGFDKFRVSEAPDVGLNTLANFANVSIYPSPFNENLTIESTSSADEISIEVYEMTSGRKVDTRSFANSPLISFENSYARGIYLIRVYGDDQLLKIEKVVKM